MQAMDNVRRLTGNTTGGGGFGAAMSAQERKELRDIIMEAVRDTVAAAIDERSSGGAGATEQANSLKTIREESASLKEQLQGITRSIATLTNQVKALQNNNNNGGGGGGGSGGGTRWVFDKNNKPKQDWSKTKKTWWWKNLKEKFPEDYKDAMKERIEKEMASRLAKLDEGN